MVCMHHVCDRMTEVVCDRMTEVVCECVILMCIFKTERERERSVVAKYRKEYCPLLTLSFYRV